MIIIISYLDTGSETAIFIKNSKYQGRKSQRIGGNTIPSGDEIKKQKMKQSLEMYVQNIKRAQADPLVFSNFENGNHFTQGDSGLCENTNISKSKDKNEKSNLMIEMTDKSQKIEEGEKSEKINKSEKSVGIDISSLTLISLYKNSGNCVRLRVNGTLVPSYLLRRYARTPGRVQSISSFPNPSNTCPRNLSPTSSSSSSSSSTSPPITSPLNRQSYENCSNECMDPNKNKISIKSKNEIVPKGAFFLESCWALCK